MLLEVPREQLIMGIPFYNRLWREVVLEGGAPTTRHFNMDTTRDFFDERGVVWEWHSDIGSYYGEVMLIEDGETVLWRVWLEDENSINAKMQIFESNNLAGIASWRRGFENEATWETIGRFFP
jgi:spore germination protein YaaH